MNGRALTPGNSNSEKNLFFNQIRYVKPMFLGKEEPKQSRNLYYDNNPYFLNNHLLSNRAKGIYNTTRNSNPSRDLSQTSSQRSSKVVRANGLRLAEKPRIVKGVMPQRPGTQARNNEQTRKLFDRNIELEEQNRLLKEQNNRLRENMRIMSEMHKSQIDQLNQKFQTLLKKTQQLEIDYQTDEKLWYQQLQQSSHTKTSNFSQLNLNSHPNVNSANGNTTLKPYHNHTLPIQNNGQSSIRN